MANIYLLNVLEDSSSESFACISRNTATSLRIKKNDENRRVRYEKTYVRLVSR